MSILGLFPRGFEGELCHLGVVFLFIKKKMEVLWQRVEKSKEKIKKCTKET